MTAPDHETPSSAGAGTPTLRGFIRDPVVLLATGAGFGFSPFAPGTVGGLWGIPLAIAIGQLASPIARAACIMFICAAGIPLCTAAARRLGNLKDPGAIAFDEIASLPIAMFGFRATSPLAIAAAFVAFRVFDVWKPFPARNLERLPSGLGIMADDWIAALYANLSLRLAFWATGAFEYVT